MYISKAIFTFRIVRFLLHNNVFLIAFLLLMNSNVTCNNILTSTCAFISIKIKFIVVFILGELSCHYRAKKKWRFYLNKFNFRKNGRIHISTTVRLNKLLCIKKSNAGIFISLQKKGFHLRFMKPFWHTLKKHLNLLQLLNCI